MISYRLERDMAYDGCNLSQRFILHCDGVEMVRKDVSFGSRSYLVGNKAFLSSYVTRLLTLVISSLRHKPFLQSNQICWTIRCAAHAMHIW